MMWARVGIEKRLRPVKCELAQNAGLRELVERVVDGSQRNGRLRLDGLQMKYLGCDMAVTFAEQQPPKIDALTCRAQSYLAQERLHIMAKLVRQFEWRRGAVGSLVHLRMSPRPHGRHGILAF